MNLQEHFNYQMIISLKNTRICQINKFNGLVIILLKLSLKIQMLQKRKIILLLCLVRMYLIHHKNSMPINSIFTQLQNTQLTVDASIQKCILFTIPILIHLTSQHLPLELCSIQRDITRKSQKKLLKLLINFLIPCNCN